MTKNTKDILDEIKRLELATNPYLELVELIIISKFQ